MKNAAMILARGAFRQVPSALPVSWAWGSWPWSASVLAALSLAVAVAGCPAEGRKTHVTPCRVDNECSGGLCIQSQCEPGDGDKDGDGLPNRVEQELGTDPARADTDGDGADDLAEVGGDRAHPLDSDGDGVIDALESALLDADHDCLVDSEDPQETTLSERRTQARCPSAGLCAGAPEGTFTITCERPDGAAEVVWSCAVAALDGHEVQETLCDQQDNDCDGQTDEGPDGQPMTCCQDDTACADLAVAPTCQDPATCAGTETVATCDPETHACVTETRPAPAACAGEPCGQATCAADGATFRPPGTCSAQGSCDAPDPTSCDDGDLCTVDTCNPVAGCVHTALTCDDGDPCTVDTCDPVDGCVHGPLACDDSNPCTEDQCVEGTCQHPPLLCDDGDPCTSDTCDPAVGCVSTAILCDDGDPCTVDTCDPATGDCIFSPDNDGAPCDDGDPCTQHDVCAGGQCVGVALVGATALAPLDDTAGLVDSVRGVTPLTLPDGTVGYALAGEAWALGDSGDVPGQGWVGVVDGDGVQRWGLALGGPGDDGLQGVAALPGGGFVAVGTYAAPGSQRDDLWVVLVVPTGEQASPYAVTGWRLFDSGGDDAAFAVAAVPEGFGPDPMGAGFVVAGRAGGGQTMKDGWLMRFDAQGRDLWRRTFGGPGDDELLAVAVGDDGLLYAAGTSGPGPGPSPAAPGTQDADAWLLVVDGRGQLVRERRWDVGGGWDDEARAVVPVFSSANGAPRSEGVLLAGRTRDHAATGTFIPQRAWTVRLDAFGALAWDHLVPAPGQDPLDNDTAFYGAAADAGGFVLVGAHGVAPYAVGLDPLGNVRWTRPVPAGGPLTSLAPRPGGLGWVVGARSEADTVQLVRLDAWGHGACQEAGACAVKTVADCADGGPCTLPACEPGGAPGGGDSCAANVKGVAASCPGADACHPVGACDDAGSCVAAARLFSWVGAEATDLSVADLVPTRRGGYALFGKRGDGVQSHAHGWYLSPDGVSQGGGLPYVEPDGVVSEVAAATRVYDGRMVVAGAEGVSGASGAAIIQWLEPDGAPIPGLTSVYSASDPAGETFWTDVAASADGRAVAALGYENGGSTPWPIFQTWDARGNAILDTPVSVGTGAMLDTLDVLAPVSAGGWVAAGQLSPQFGLLAARAVWFDLQGQGSGEVLFQDPQGGSLLPFDVAALPDGRVVIVGERQGGAVGMESFIAVVSGPGGAVSNLTILGADDGSPLLDRIVRGPLGLVAVGRATVGADVVVVGFALEPNVQAGASSVVRSWTWTPPGALSAAPGEELKVAALPGGDLLVGGTLTAASGAPQPFVARLDPWGNAASCEGAASCGVMDVRQCDGPVDASPCTTSYCDASLGGCLGEVSQPNAVCLGGACSAAGACSDTDGCGQPLSCDDGDACTLDACVEGFGCVHTPDPDWSQCCQDTISPPDTAPDCDADGVADVCASADGHAQPVTPGVWLRGDDLSQPLGDPALEVALAFTDPVSVTFVAHGEERGVELRMAEPFGAGAVSPNLPGGASLLGVSIYQAWPAPAGSPGASAAADAWAAGMDTRLELHHDGWSPPSPSLQHWDGQTWAYQDATTSTEVAGDRVRLMGVGAGPGPCAPFLVAVVVDLTDASGTYHKLVKILGASATGDVVAAYPYDQLIAP